MLPASQVEEQVGCASRRVTALVGPAGSGKTELAIALALARAEATGRRVVLADLDVVKPYFRSREMQARLRGAGVDILAPPGELATADLPIVTSDLRAAIVRKDASVVLDVGGDPVGARALGSISDVFGAAEHDLLLVLNACRPFMDDAARVVETARLIEAASQVAITGVISNTHLLGETTLEQVLDGLALARSVAERLGVPVRLLGAPDALVPELATRAGSPPLVSIRRHVLPTFLGGSVL